jgi:hypothetical protein
LEKKAKAYRWHRRHWLFQESNLSLVRSIVDQLGRQFGWEVKDLLQRSSREHSSVLPMSGPQYEKHVELALRFLTDLPDQALLFIDWRPHLLIFKLMRPLTAKLEKVRLRVTLSEEFLPEYLAEEKAPSWGWFIIADDVRVRFTLLRALPMMFKRVRHLETATGLTVEQRFGERLHLRDADGKLWFGAPYQSVIQTSLPPGQPGSVYSVFFERDNDPYLVMSAEAWFQGIMAWVNYQRQKTLPFTHISADDSIMAVALTYHLEDWLAGWTRQLLNHKECSMVEDIFPSSAWNDPRFAWFHPAEHFLMHLHWEDSFSGMHALLDFSQDDLYHHYDQMMQLKRLYGEQYRQYCIEHAVELVKPWLFEWKKEIILELAHSYVPLKKSWSKTRMIKTLLESGEPCLRFARARLGIDRLPHKDESQ